MADRDFDFLLIGGGLAAARCAGELRKRGAEGSIAIVGREQDPPYERPPLSKEYLRGESERADAYALEADWYADNDVELITGRSVMGLDTEARTAKLQGKEVVGFDKALIATGAMVNILRVEGAQLDGIHYLRAFGNADSIRQDVATAERVVLIGGSYIGCEVAASLTEMGKRCTIVMQEDITLQNTFGPEVGRHFHELLTGRGIEIHGGESLDGFEGDVRVGTRAHRVWSRAPLRRGRRRRRSPPGHDARRTGRARGRRRDRLRFRSRDLGRGNLRGRRLLQLRRASHSVGGSASSTGTSPSSRVRTRPAACSATSSPTKSSRTSSATSRTGPRSST